MNKQQKEEHILKTGLRIFLVIVAVMFIYFGWFANLPCDIDNQYLFCHLKVTSLWDWVGSILFLGGLLVMSGAFKSINKSLSAPNSLDTKLFVLIAAIVGGIILLWNA